MGRLHKNICVEGFEKQNAGIALIDLLRCQKYAWGEQFTQKKNMCWGEVSTEKHAW